MSATISDRRTLLRVLAELAERPDQSARSLAIVIFDEHRGRTAERGRISRVVGLLLEAGFIVETGTEAAMTGSVRARRYSLAPGMRAEPIALALAEGISLWEALLRSRSLDQTG